MSQLTYYTNPMSRGQISHWMLEETGAPYETVWLRWGPAGNKSPEYLHVNPMGKVPCLVHGEAVVTEAAAICMYLADIFPERGLGPQATEKADYYRWTFFAAGPLEHAVTSKAMGWEVSPEKASTLGFGSYEATVKTLAQHLSQRDFVCGARFTAADVYVGSSVAWGVEFGTLPKEPSFVAYIQRLQARDAYQRSKTINGQKIAEMQAAHAAQ